MTENYLIIDESGLYVIGYVIDNKDVKYIAYSNRDSCSIELLNYEVALKRKELLEKSQQKLIEQNKITSNHTFHIIKA
jgi:hypothetical protein